jgi:hypothetical protein
MPRLPTSEDLGGLPQLQAARPIASYDVSPHVRGRQQVAEAGARVGQAVEDVGQSAFRLGRQQAQTEAVNANAFIHARLIEARVRYRHDADFGTLPQRWAEESGKIVDEGLAQISDAGLREHVRGNLFLPLAQENAAIADQVFRGAAAAHDASRTRYLNNLVEHVSLDPHDALIGGGIDALHSAVDDAVTRGFITPERARAEKQSAALRLCEAEYARMTRVDPDRAIRELRAEAPGHPLLSRLPEPIKDALVRQAFDRKENDRRDSEQASLSQSRDIQRQSDSAESEIVSNLVGSNPTLTRTAIADDDRLTPIAKAYMLALADRTGKPDPDADTSNPNALALINRLRLGDADPYKITALRQIYEAYAQQQLNRDDFNFVRNEFSNGDPRDFPTLLAHKTAFFKAVMPLIDQSDPLTGDIDHVGRSKLYMLERDVAQKIERLRNEAKDPTELFDPSRSDYIGTPESLQRYLSTTRERVEDHARRLSLPAQTSEPTASTPIPPRQPGETPEAYLERTIPVPRKDHQDAHPTGD